MRSDKQQISYWVSQSKDSQYRFSNGGHKEDFERAKRQTAKLKNEFAEANIRYQPTKALLEQRQVEFDKAKKAFEDRLNWLKKQSEERRQKLGKIALNASYYGQLAKARGIQLYKDNVQPWKEGGIQSKEDFCTVKVRSGWSIEFEMPATDCLIYVRGIRDKHYHIVYSEDGRELISEWRNNH